MRFICSLHESCRSLSLNNLLSRSGIAGSHLLESKQNSSHALTIRARIQPTYKNSSDTNYTAHLCEGSLSFTQGGTKTFRLNRAYPKSQNCSIKITLGECQPENLNAQVLRSLIRLFVQFTDLTELSTLY